MGNEDILGLIGGVFGCSVILIMLALAVLIWWKIFDKAGYGGVFGLLMIVPLVNIVMLCILAFGTWPILRELEALRGQVHERSRELRQPTDPTSGSR